MQKDDAPTAPVYPRAVNHVGVGVADIERAIRWYGEVLGFTLLEILILPRHFCGFPAARWEWSKIQGELCMATILLRKCLVKTARSLFRLSQKLLCASITRMDIGWTITISLWIVLVPPFVLN